MFGEKRRWHPNCCVPRCVKRLNAIYSSLSEAVQKIVNYAFLRGGGLLVSPPTTYVWKRWIGALNMQANRIDFEAGFSLLKIPFSNRPLEQPLKGSADTFKRASVLTDANVSYAMNSHETNAKR